MNQDEHKQRVVEAMRRYIEAQEIRPAGRQRPLLRRKNNFVRGSMEIFCQQDNVTDRRQIPIRGASNGQ
ncbi:MAG: hypothetical protein CVU51_02980 [Deltaproteobacteria bacterium HGW-Deltaproteobacteria-1]|jgi:hypothetical protein|nr:MAG: hypothetical protein CVU51_02980 [Deltaproteobacteria bacterium HGW-Deltaproteobacteria-1]